MIFNSKKENGSACTSYSSLFTVYNSNQNRCNYRSFTPSPARLRQSESSSGDAPITISDERTISVPSTADVRSPVVPVAGTPLFNSFRSHRSPLPWGTATPLLLEHNRCCFAPEDVGQRSRGRGACSLHFHGPGVNRRKLPRLCTISMGVLNMFMCESRLSSRGEVVGASASEEKRAADVKQRRRKG